VWPVEYPRDDEEEPFYSDIFPLLDDSKIFNLKAIRAYTSYKVSIMALTCQNMKNQSNNYCKILLNCEAEKKICELRTKYVYFYVDKSKRENTHTKPTVYLLVFTKSTRDFEIKSIVDEIKKITMEWLDITNSFINCYIFEYSKYPKCGIMNESTIIKRFDEHCADINFKCRASSIRAGQWLYINGGDPIFTFVPQDR
jgi:hypothetical protein